MSEIRFSKIIRHIAPGETRAVLMGTDGRAYRIFIERWSGQGEPARFGSIHKARLRRFADELKGAFLELESGEEAFLRLKSRDGLTEGAELTVEIAAEARRDKLARCVRTDTPPSDNSAFDAWLSDIPDGASLPINEDRNLVDAAFDDALSPSATLPTGGHLHIDRTRALTAFDIDTAGRVGKGSAGARALAINKEAVQEMVRQVSLRGLGGNLVLDCVGPLNRQANETLRTAARDAFEQAGLQGAKVLMPSPLGLMEASLPWTRMPIEDRLSRDPDETRLMDLFRAAQREAEATPSALFDLKLCPKTWAAYLNQKAHADHALAEMFGGRIRIVQSATGEDGIEKR